MNKIVTIQSASCLPKQLEGWTVTKNVVTKNMQNFKKPVDRKRRLWYSN